jgi:hypothetical protein
MRIAQIVAKLAHAPSERLRPSMPLASALWHIVTLAQYLKRVNQVTRRQNVVLRHFPKPIRRPTGTGRAYTSPLQLMDDAMMAVGQASSAIAKAWQGQAIFMARL